jgi:hypothetical protein
MAFGDRMNTRFTTTFVFAVIWVGVLALSSSCERYNTKKEIRDRRMDYYQHYLDSVRTHNDMLKDSLRKEQLKQQKP